MTDETVTYPDEPQEPGPTDTEGTDETATDTEPEADEG